MKILAIETSCDDTGVAIVENGRNVISSKVSSQIKIHNQYGGVVPEVASRCHVESIAQITKRCLIESNMDIHYIDAVAVTYAPGLIGSLLVGLNFAKGLAFAHNKKLIPVHHLRGHIASLYISNPDLEPPFICLIASGGHTHIVEVKEYTELKILGRTKDDAVGESFDKIARVMGLEYPGGVSIDKIADSGNPDRFKLTIPSNLGYNFSFSGLKTSMINTINSIRQKNSDLPINDISASFRKNVVEYLIKNLLLAVDKSKYNKVAISGGVSANSLLRRRMYEECEKNNLKYFEPLMKYCGDNAAMIGSQAYYERSIKNFAYLSQNAHSNLSII